MTNENSKNRGGEHGEKKRTFFNFPLAFLLSLCAGFADMIVLVSLLAFTELTPGTAATLSIILLLIFDAAIVLTLFFTGRAATRREVILHRFSKMLDNMVYPYIITNQEGVIVKRNNAAEELFSHRMPGAMPNVSAVIRNLTPEKINESVGKTLPFRHEMPDGSNRYMTIRSTKTVIGDEKNPGDRFKGAYYISTIVDCTDDKTVIDEARRRIEYETAAVGRIEIDDLKAFSGASGVSEKQAADKVRELLSEWVHERCGIMYEPETRKFIAIMPFASMRECEKEQFPILDTVREALTVGDDELTVSMGFSASGRTLSERMRNADLAFEQRKGGNKVIVNHDGRFEDYGRDRRKQANTDIFEYPRVARSLKKYISECSNVLIMGHARPDYDSIGAAIGIGKLVREHSKPMNIVINDPSDVNFAMLTESLAQSPEYEGVFIGEQEAMSRARTDTLLIIVDVNNFRNTEAPELYRTLRETLGGKIIILDHHEKNENTARCDYDYIDTTASSACEIASGILDIGLRKSKLSSDEATAMLAGIMLDTKNFTQYASRKTYAAAEFLSLSSARVDKVRKFFEADYETFNAQYRIGAGLQLLCDGRIAVCMGEGLEDEGKTKIVIGRVADQLLSMSGALASIVIAEWNGRINASARSNNSIVDCAQLLRGVGGGNFNNAGGYSADMTLKQFRKVIDDNIAEYFSRNIDKN